jgi:hypothetical protein
MPAGTPLSRAGSLPQEARDSTDSRNRLKTIPTFFREGLETKLPLFSPVASGVSMTTLHYIYDPLRGWCYGAKVGGQGFPTLALQKDGQFTRVDIGPCLASPRHSSNG